MFTLTPDQLKAIVPSIKPANTTLYAPLLTKYMDKYQINTKARVAPFLANLAVESAGFNATREFASGKAYEGRLDLGNTQKGDGVRFAGRGLIQTTGRSNYAACSKALFGDDRLLKNPEILEQPDPATESACWFWTVVKSLNAVADKPDDWTRVWKNKTYSKFEWIVLRINGGQNDLDKRKVYLQNALKVLPQF